MKILAFETLSNAVSTALLVDGKIVSQNISSDTSKQSETLVLEIEKILQQNNLWYENLDYIACSKGPASFTGTRISLVCARTIKIAKNIPLILLNSCEIIAYKYRNYSGEIISLIQANPVEFFYSKSSEKNHSNPRIIALEDLPKIFSEEKFLLCGSGKNIAAQILQNHQFEMNYDEDVIRANLIAELAYKKIKSGEILSEDLSPIYLRSPNITERKK
jgi:tRNA threonylcarbamoyladenosine biosynthesis protein TsaB